MDKLIRKEITIKLLDYFNNLEKIAKNQLANDMAEKLGHVIGPGKIVKVVTDGTTIGSIEDCELYLITRFVKNCKFSGDMSSSYSFKIDALENYFSIIDMDNANSLPDLTQQKNIFEMKALYKGTEDNPEWIGILGYKEIVEITRNGLIRYNMETQRVANCYISNGNTFYLPDINQETILAIKDDILNNRFISNTITLNLIKEGNERFYNPTEEDNILTIDTDKYYIDIIDGMHRIKGIVAAWMERERQIRNGEETKQIEGTMAVSVKNLSKEQARHFIYQESLANRQAKKTIQIFAPDSFLSLLLRKLNDNTNKNNPFRNNIRDSLDSKMSYAFVFSILSDTNLIFDYYSSIKKKDVDSIANDLVVTAEIIFDSLMEDESFKKHKKIYYSQCFLVGIIIFYLSNVKLNGKIELINPAVRDCFIEKVLKTVDKQKFLFEYPFSSSKESKRIKDLYTKILDKEERKLLK